MQLSIKAAILKCIIRDRRNSLSLGLVVKLVFQHFNSARTKFVFKRNKHHGYIDGNKPGKQYNGNTDQADLPVTCDVFDDQQFKTYKQQLYGIEDLINQFPKLI